MSHYTLPYNPSTPVTPAAGTSTMFVDQFGNLMGKRSSGAVKTYSSGYSQIFASTTASTTSSSYSVINSMTKDLPEGDFMVFFNCDAIGQLTAICTIGLHIDGVLYAESERTFQQHVNTGHSHSNNHAITLIVGISLAESATIDIRFKTSSNTLTINKRTLIVHRGDLVV
jgi:hypothetical protein